MSITVPQRNGRFGREDAFRFLGNALPVLAVHDTNGWHLDPYVSTGESAYALASDFHVRAGVRPSSGSARSSAATPTASSTW
ncbi:hypothetical protein [Streptomyces lincolnensis]|uniref:hypothetical protein n=1 Tax=Streptomyces lincolnensis TaxID=1915 RepID=UPI0035AB6AF1